ncbi:helix-turn-helix domain-containing protein [Hyphomonas sp.]|uniref:AraC family transcriptional regulator n=1 Tax=Hyphomonas sp. TaxID=87 RepID=UPI0030F68472
MTTIERPSARLSLGLDGATSRLSPAEGMMLLANNAVNTNDETHALGLNPLPRGYASIGARVMFSCPTLGSALNATSNYFNSAYGVFALDLAETGTDARLTLRAQAPDGRNRANLEAIWISLVTVIASRYLGHDLPVRKAGLHPLADVTTRLSHSLEGVPVDRSTDTYIEFAADLLDTPGSIRNTRTPLLDSLIFAICPPTPSIEAQNELVFPATLEAYEDEHVSSDMSNRQKRRIIRQVHGDGFRSLALKARAEQAVALLTQTGTSIGDVAEMMGYADERSFRRFILNQTGRSPSEIRRIDSQEQSESLSRLRSQLENVTRMLEI